MGTIIERKRADGSTAYLARVTVKNKGKVIFQQFQNFDRRPAAEGWVRQLEKTVKQPGGIELVQGQAKARTLRDAIDIYLKESGEKIGRTKATSSATF